MEVFRNIESLAQRIRRPLPNRFNIVILLAASREDLADILSIRYLFHDVSIILVLPDQEAETIAKGHTLRPRFLTYTDSDFEEVAAVLNKMI